jgi:putative Mg2+ transporter-C (MgtC) family protein
VRFAAGNFSIRWMPNRNTWTGTTGRVPSIELVCKEQNCDDMNPNPLTDELLNLPDAAQMARVTIRLVTAALLGGLLGAEREMVGKAAGLRTHMLVALGAALFVLVPAELGMTPGDLGRVIQGVAAGIGFLGAGTILKRSDQEEITGLTTAASIWLTAAIGLSVGVGRLWLPIVSAIFAWVILYVLGTIERRIQDSRRRP